MPECILPEIIEGTRYVFLQKFRQCSMFKRQILLLYSFCIKVGRASGGGYYNSFKINLAANMPECILREIIEGTRYVSLQKFRQCSMFNRQILLLHNGFLLHVVVTIKMR